MAIKNISAFLECLSQNGWKLKLKDIPSIDFDGEIFKRHPNLPTDFAEFLSIVAYCANSTGNIWFVTGPSHCNDPKNTIPWNCYEKMSIEAFSKYNQYDELPWIKEFWDAHLPFLISEKYGFAYLAIGTGVGNYGEIVRGREPEFEEAVTIYSSFTEFCEAYCFYLNGDLDNDDLSDYW